MTNTVELLGFYGSDLTIACSAWTSTSRDLTPEKLERVPKLIDMLYKDGHHTPFEKGTVHFLVNCDIASHIHLLKSRIGVSVNSESARYKELKEDKYYLPEDWIGIIDSEATKLRNDDEVTTWLSNLYDLTQTTNKLYHQCIADLTPVLGRKRAKESARYFKMYNSQITCDVMFNMRSFFHFLTLRNSDHSQREIHELASQMLELIKNIEGNPFKHSIEAYERYKKVD